LLFSSIEFICFGALMLGPHPPSCNYLPLLIKFNLTNNNNKKKLGKALQDHHPFHLRAGHHSQWSTEGAAQGGLPPLLTKTFEMVVDPL
jgi:hypothetical protein